MATNSAAEVYDLLILVDATYSMINYLEALKTSLPKVIALSTLTNNFARIGLLAYRDYSEASRVKDGMLEWSGWYDHENPDVPGNVNAETLIATAANLEPTGGGDYPEATKTGLARAYELMRNDATTIILLYTDAPPHCWMVTEKHSRGNYRAEQAALGEPNSYGGYGPYFVDWVTACNYLHDGPKKAHVWCFLDQQLSTEFCDAGYYNYLSAITRGACFSLIDSKPHSIAQLTVDVLLAWMGTEKAGQENISMHARLTRYKSGKTIRDIKDEKDVNAKSYFFTHSDTEVLRNNVSKMLEDNLAMVEVDSNVLKSYLPKRKTPIGDFSRRYAESESFKHIVVNQLMKIIELDVTSMSLNPVFGTLWRTVCNDRNNPARDNLIASFGLHIEKIANNEEKSRMKKWLEESYDYAAEILETLEAVPSEQRYPCVFLDPTITFQQPISRGERDEEVPEGDGDGQSITKLRRDELLEIGRSCDGRILHRLGRILTQVTYAETEADLPKHIASTSNMEVPKIPLSLASAEHGWKFWKILLHTVLPGTMLATRPSMILAALSIRIGLKPLFGAASAAMMFWRDKWSNIEVPETWNSSCLGLLLDADEGYRRNVQDGDLSAVDAIDSLLTGTDRKLFSQLVAYHHLKKNLLTTLTAKIGWTPEKSQFAMGPVVTCRRCKFPRSVTIMAEKSGHVCGVCLGLPQVAEDQRVRTLNSNVTKEDNESSTAVWVECSIRKCRAQYVCYNPGNLNVRPKCHYCRMHTGQPKNVKKILAPTLECVNCLSRVIWPEEFRKNLIGPFLCVACQTGCDTIVSVESNANALCQENGDKWLLRNDNKTIKEPFQRTLFHTISTVGPEAFMSNVEVLPSDGPDYTLKLRGKQIRNQGELLAELLSWIRRRTSQKSTCSLCFNDYSKERLLPACRRRGCHQQICETCSKNWYGLNRAGTIINTATLYCPFCRRHPAARTLAAYGKGIHAVGDLKIAIRERGSWIHAWCLRCGKAKRFMERVCARGAPVSVNSWTCDNCALSELAQAQIAEEEAQRAYQLSVELDAREHAAVRRRLEDARSRRLLLQRPVKNCPGCDTPTEKVQGCDHITCSIPDCNTDWCWSCGGQFPGYEIYGHLDEVHGGLNTGDI